MRVKTRVKYWEIIAEKLSASGLSWGCSSEIDATGRVLYTANAYAKDGNRFTVISDERLTAFLELEKLARLRCPSWALGDNRSSRAITR
jgi:hypothetical protein